LTPYEAVAEDPEIDRFCLLWQSSVICKLMRITKQIETNHSREIDSMNLPITTRRLVSSIQFPNPNHWAAFSIDADAAAIFLADSAPQPSNTAYAREVLTELARLFTIALNWRIDAQRWEFKEFHTPLQVNDVECGTITACNIALMLREHEPLRRHHDTLSTFALRKRLEISTTLARKIVPTISAPDFDESLISNDSSIHAADGIIVSDSVAQTPNAQLSHEHSAKRSHSPCAGNGVKRRRLGGEKSKSYQSGFDLTTGFSNGYIAGFWEIA